MPACVGCAAAGPARPLTAHTLLWCCGAELLARRTPGFSGAELANLVNESALLAARYDADSISLNLLDEARDKVLMGTPRALTQSDEARRLTAYHEGGHALVALHTRGAKPIHKATIVPRGHALGMVSQLPDKDEYSTTRQQMRAHIDVCMGGKAAEELIFGEGGLGLEGWGGVRCALLCSAAFFCLSCDAAAVECLMRRTHAACPPTHAAAVYLSAHPSSACPCTACLPPALLCRALLCSACRGRLRDQRRHL